MSGPRFGVFGGTFDPLHVGHPVVAQDVIEALGLDCLFVIPAARPPHREAVFPAERRLEWVRNVFHGDPRVHVSDLELRREGPSYTVDTLARLREAHPAARIFLVLGIDQFRALGSWREPDRIRRLARIAVMNRGGRDPSEVAAETGIPCESVRVTRVELSATRIRSRLQRGLGVRYLVSESIREEVERSWKELSVDGASDG